MGKKRGKTEEGNKGREIKEGKNMLGKPKFKKVENGRYRCVETGHEVPNEEAKLAYAKTKHCRIGLIHSAIAKNKPPLNIFKQDPASSSKLICQLTGDIINKSEEHIWKHINGKRFLNVLEKKEAEKKTGGEPIKGEQTLNGEPKKDHVNEKKKKKEKKKNKKKTEEKKKEKDDNINKPHSEMMNSSDKENDSEKEDFWMPSDGERWDMDDGGDRWGSGSDSDAEFKPDDEVANGAGYFPADSAADDESKDEAGELPKRTKRMSIEIGTSSFASRKKKNNTESEE